MDLDCAPDDSTGEDIDLLQLCVSVSLWHIHKLSLSLRPPREEAQGRVAFNARHQRECPEDVLELRRTQLIQLRDRGVQPGECRRITTPREQPRQAGDLTARRRR